MSQKLGSILLLRETQYHQESKKYLFPLRPICISPYRFVHRKVEIPKSEFDYILVASPQALKGLKTLPKHREIIFIGSGSQKRFPLFKGRALGQSNAKGVIRFFKEKKPSSIFFPRSSKGDPRLVHSLRKMGHRVMVRHTYGLEFLNLKSSVKAAVKKVEAIFLTSPSCFESLRQNFSVREMKGWKLAWVVIGPTTEKALKIRGIRPFVSTSADLKEMKKIWLQNRARFDRRS